MAIYGKCLFDCAVITCAYYDMHVLNVSDFGVVLCVLIRPTARIRISHSCKPKLCNLHIDRVFIVLNFRIHDDAWHVFRIFFCELASVPEDSTGFPS